MREIKFRAWNKEYKLFYYDAAIENGEVVLLDYDFSFNGWHGVKAVTIDDAIIEQYTGLKDRNGKEIYEGDIVVNTYYDDGEMYKVLWVDDSVAFGMESLDDMELYKLPLESLEVIGNIHENPELCGEEEE